MATKWKNFTRNSWVKAVTWLVSLAMVGLMTWQAMAFVIYIHSNHISIMDERMLSCDRVPDSYFAQELYFPAKDLLNRASYGNNEEAIKAGKTVDKNTLYESIYNEFCQYFYDEYYDDDAAVESSSDQANSSIYPAKEGSTNYLTDDMIDQIITALWDEGETLTDAIESARFRNWLRNNRGVYQHFLQKCIQDELNAFREITQNGDIYNQFDYYVYCKDTDTTLTNLSEADAKKLRDGNNRYHLVCAITKNDISFLSGTADPADLSHLSDDYAYDVKDAYSYDDVAYIAYKPSVLKDIQTEWAGNRKLLIQLIVVECAAAVVFLICLIILCFGAGRRPNDEKKYLVWYDRIWAEILYILYFCILGGWCCVFPFLDSSWSYLSDPMKYGLTISTTIAFAVSSLLLFLSQVRRIKAKQWLNGFLICQLFQKYVVRFVRWLAQQFQKSPLRRKILILAILLPLACMFWFTVPFIIAGLLYFGMREADSFEAVTNGAHDIRTGKTDTHIDLKHGGKELHALADDLNSISEGLGGAIDTAVKSERLKSELISNVSHDIKTPLTSIITYIDLLKKCNITDPTAQEYLAVLDQKAQRLRTLTTDLFDASKATSGAMKLHLAQTDFDALLRQALGERSEHIEKAGLDIRIQSQAPTLVNADGQLLWRILDNLISNCTRYALPGSRVYITIEPTGNTVTLTMKNISAAELNISADELMQRFTRGDRSRHTEGSGLGLSIAQSLAELMGGSCHVEIDGDLFKSVVSIPKWKDTQI